MTKQNTKNLFVNIDFKNSLTVTDSHIILKNLINSKFNFLDYTDLSIFLKRVKQVENSLEIEHKKFLFFLFLKYSFMPFEFIHIDDKKKFKKIKIEILEYFLKNVDTKKEFCEKNNNIEEILKKENIFNVILKRTNISNLTPKFNIGFEEVDIINDNNNGIERDESNLYIKKFLKDKNFYKNINSFDEVILFLKNGYIFNGNFLNFYLKPLLAKKDFEKIIEYYIDNGLIEKKPESEISFVGCITKFSELKKYLNKYPKTQITIIDEICILNNFNNQDYLEYLEYKLKANKESVNREKINKEKIKIYQKSFNFVLRLTQKNIKLSEEEIQVIQYTRESAFELMSRLKNSILNYIDSNLINISQVSTNGLTPLHHLVNTFDTDILEKISNKIIKIKKEKNIDVLKAFIDKYYAKNLSDKKSKNNIPIINPVPLNITLLNRKNLAKKNPNSISSAEKARKVFSHISKINNKYSILLEKIYFEKTINTNHCKNTNKKEDLRTSKKFI